MAPVGVGQWLKHLVIEVPYIELPGPVVDIKHGTCTGLAISGMRATDVGTPQVPEVAIHFSGVRLQCELQAHGSLTVNFGLNNSVIDLSLAVQPLPTADPALTLPFGQVKVTNCKVSVRLEYLDFHGGVVLGPMLENIHNTIRKGIQNQATSLVCSELKEQVAAQASQVTAGIAAILVPFVGATPPTTLPTAAAPLTDWSKYPPLQLMKHLIRERPQAVKQLIALADPLVIPVVDSVSLPFTRMVNSSKSSITSTWSLRSVTVRGLQTMQAKELALDGSGPFLDLTAAFAHVGITIGMGVTVDSMSGQVGARHPLPESLNLTLDLGNAHFALHILAMLSKPALGALYVDQMQKPSCFANCARQAASPWNSSLGMWDWAIGTTPTLTLEMPGAAADFADSVDVAVASLFRGYTPSMEALLKGWIQIARSELDAAMWQGLDLLPPCGTTKVYLGPGDFVSDALLALGCGLLLFGAATAVAPAWAVPRLPWQAKEPSPEDWPMLGAEGISRQVLTGGSGSLCSHAVVPVSVARLYPLAAVAAMVLFLYSDLCIATSINFVFFAEGDELTIGPALAFSVVICAIDAFQAGAYCIAICIGFMSILWPFVKLVLLIYAWVAPTARLSLKARDKLLRFLDEYGKWSLIDTWLGILALACYQLGWHSKSTDAHFLVDPVPEMPFFMFVGASVLALILGHVASGFHRFAADRDADSADVINELHALCRPLCGYTRPMPSFMVSLGLLLTGVLIGLGAVVSSFEMVESGALAILLLEPREKVTRYSLVGLGMQMTSGKSANVGLRSVQAIFFLFSLFIPIALQGLLLALWVLPLSYGSQLLVLDACRALDAWAAFDVFTMAVTVSHFEFGLFSKFVMHYNNLGEGCGLVEEYLHTECFHMECSLSTGFSILASAAILSYAVPKLALYACRTALEERCSSDQEASDAETDVLVNDAASDSGCSGGDSDKGDAPRWTRTGWL